MMKKIIPLSFGTMLLLASCDKTTIQQTAQTIKNADSLYQNVSRGYKTVDSISKTWKKEEDRLPPEIREKTEDIRKNIDLKNLSVKNIDSVTAALKDLSKNVQGGTDIAKSIDSATSAIKNSDDPLTAISAVTSAINKISKKNTAKIQQRQDPEEESSDDQIPDDPAFSQQPVTKSADVTIIVDDLQTSEEKLRTLLKKYHADIVTNSRTDSEGTKHEDFSVKIPLKNFDEGIASLSGNLGSIAEKSVSTEGTDYRPEQMCDIRISLRQNPDVVGKDLGTTDGTETKPEDESNSYSSGFAKGLRGLAAAFGMILPFWPIFLIGGIAWYFIARKKRRKEEREILRQTEYNEEMRKKIAEQNSKSEQRPVEKTTEEIPKKAEEPDDYSRFMPK